MVRISNVMAIANTPSLSASTRDVLNISPPFSCSVREGNDSFITKFRRRWS
jgi:hypothetical protein